MIFQLLYKFLYINNTLKMSDNNIIVKFRIFEVLDDNNQISNVLYLDDIYLKICCILNGGEVAIDFIRDKFNEVLSTLTDVNPRVSLVQTHITAKNHQIDIITNCLKYNDVLLMPKIQFRNIGMTTIVLIDFSNFFY